MPNPNLRVLQATVHDVPNLANIFFGAFQNSLAYQCFPNVPSVRNWFIKSNTEEFKDPNTLFLKVIEKKNGYEDGPIVAFAKWKKLVKEDRVEPLPEWPKEGNTQLANEFFGQLKDGHRRLMGDRPHWYLALLATSPSHQGQGAGSLLLKDILARADAEQIEAYLEASPEGEPLYRKRGFEAQEKVNVTVTVDGKPEPYLNTLMVRKPQPSAT